MTSLVPSVVALGALALLALSVTRIRTSPPHAAAQRRMASWSLLAALGAQGGHFAEELATGFQAQFPALFGQPAMPTAAFVAINVACLIMWAVSVPGLRSGRRPAFAAAWFLAFAGVANLIGHPLMALVAGGYFPGLATAPLVGAAAGWLWWRLMAATERNI